MALRETGNKITFANQLRGLAVLSVIVAHYIGVYWFARDTVATYIRAPIAEGPAPGVAFHIAFPSFNYGPFGVAVFFLISGFVIPFSLEKLGPVKFMLARLFRIIPTYWAATAVTVAVVYASGRYWGQSFFFTTSQIVKNLLLIHQQTNTPSFDLVNWTLAIEVLFYLCSVCMLPFIRRASSLALVNFSLVLLAALVWWPAAWDEPFAHGDTLITLAATKSQLMMVAFIFIGTLFNFRMRESISRTNFAGSVAAIFVAFLMMWQHTPFAGQFWQVPANYGYGLIVFSVCFCLRNRFRPSKLLDFFASISYPLYLVHSITGYAIIRVLMAHHFRFFAAAPIALAAAIGIAYVLHVLVELPTASLWKNAKKPAADQPKHYASNTGAI